MLKNNVILRTEDQTLLPIEVENTIAKQLISQEKDVVFIAANTFTPKPGDTSNNNAYLTNSYKTRLERATKAFQLGCDAYALERPNEAKKLEILKKYASELQKNYLKLLSSFAANNSTQQHQALLTRYLQHLEMLLMSELSLSKGAVRKLMDKADEYSLLDEEKPILTTATSYQYKDPVTNQLTDGYLVQMEVPQHSLDPMKWKDEFLKAKSSNGKPNADAPVWYKKMHKDERILFDYMMRDANETNMEEKIKNISSRLRTIPGVANFSKHVMAVVDKNGNVIFRAPDRYRSSMISSRDLRHKGHDLRDQVTQYNLQQIIRNTISSWLNDPAKNAAFKIPGTDKIDINKLSDIPILVQTLISPSALLGLFVPDPKLFEDKQRAVQAILKNGISMDVNGVQQTIRFKNIIATNHPLNKARYAARTGAAVLETGDSKKEALKLTKIAIETTERLSKEFEQKQATRIAKETIDHNYVAPSVTSELQKEKSVLDAHCKLLTIAARDLEKIVNDVPSLTTSLIKDNQRELHIAALEEFITSRLGGISYGSCVSGKDRKGLETMYVDAMELYYQRYHDLPKYDDSKNNRKNFVDIFTDIYLSRHQHVNAGQNAPGAEGVKTPAQYLPKDIQEAIKKKSGHPTILKESDRLASNNEFQKVLRQADDTLFKQGRTLTILEKEKAHHDFYKFNYQQRNHAASANTLDIEREFAAFDSAKAKTILEAAIHQPSVNDIKAAAQTQGAITADKKEMVRKIEALINSGYWDDKGLGGLKVPNGISKMRKMLQDPAYTKANAEIKFTKLADFADNRIKLQGVFEKPNQYSKAFYDIILDIKNNPIDPNITKLNEFYHKQITRPEKIINILNAILSDPYWNDKGKAFIGKNKVPAGIEEMRKYLNNHSKDYPKNIMQELAEICISRLEQSGTNRHFMTQELYALVIKVADNMDDPDVYRDQFKDFYHELHPQMKEDVVLVANPSVALGEDGTNVQKNSHYQP